MGLAVPPLFTCLWFTDPRGRVCRPNARSFATDFAAIEVGTGCAPWRAPVACPGRRSVTAPFRLKATRTVCLTTGRAPNPCRRPPSCDLTAE